jgi:hypothetical protein
MDVKELGTEDMYWIHLAQCVYHWRAFVSTVMDLQFAHKAENIFTSFATVLRSDLLYVISQL